MKISTVSAVVGGYECNARCPFCVRLQTPFMKYDGKTIIASDMAIGCRLGERAGATTCLLTGKGEPLLYPDQVTQTLEIVCPHFPFVELQTNGIELPTLGIKGVLKSWYGLGLRTICLSTVHYNHERNKEIYADNYKDIKHLKDILDMHNLRLRISVIMVKGYIDSLEEVQKMISYAQLLGTRGRKVQLTIRPVVVWGSDNKTATWTKDHMIADRDLMEITEWISKHPKTLHLGHGGDVYDIDGQNLCYTNCLTTSPSTEELRQIILYPDGTISYDWKYESAILM